MSLVNLLSATEHVFHQFKISCAKVLIHYTIDYAVHARVAESQPNSIGPHNVRQGCPDTRKCQNQCRWQPTDDKNYHYRQQSQDKLMFSLGL